LHEDAASLRLKSFLKDAYPDKTFGRMLLNKERPKATGNSISIFLDDSQTFETAYDKYGDDYLMKQASSCSIDRQD
jgi:hypothetical protein